LIDDRTNVCDDDDDDDDDDIRFLSKRDGTRSPVVAVNTILLICHQPLLAVVRELIQHFTSYPTRPKPTQSNLTFLEKKFYLLLFL